jgi:hypothetical protein
VFFGFSPERKGLWNTNKLEERFKFLDLLKAYAVVMMIQGHTLSAVLEPEAKQTFFYQFLHILRGLTAPAFLIASGCGLAFSLCRMKNQKTQDILKKRITRILPILIAGYFLHLPRFSLYQLLTQTSGEEIAQLFQCDILQTIGWTILILQVFLIFIKEKRIIISSSIIVLLLILYFTPAVNRSISSPNFLTQLLTTKFGSGFPLFPFSAYLIFGLIFGLVFNEFYARIEIRRLSILIFISGIIFFVFSFLIKLENFNLFYFRTGLLLMLISLFLPFEHKSGKVLDFFVIIGQESFLIYIFHLVIVYGSALNKGFVYYWKEELDTFTSTMLALGLIYLMLLLGYVWHHLKNRKPVVSKVLRNTLFALLFVEFVTNL